MNFVYKSEQEVFTQRLNSGFSFSCYQNAQCGIQTSQTIDEVIGFYLGYEIWDYFYHAEFAKKDHQRPTTIVSQQYPSRTSLAQVSSVQSQHSSYFTKGPSFIYQNNYQQFNPVDGLKTLVRLDSEKNFDRNQLYSLYGHLIYDLMDRQNVILACGWSQVGLQRAQISQSLQELYKRLETYELFERGAAIAICHFDYSKCLDFLLKSKQNDEVYIIVQVVQGLKNIDLLFNEDSELRQFFCFQVNDPAQQQNKSETSNSLDFEKFQKSKLFDPKYDPSDIVNIHSKAFRIEIVKKNLEFIQQFVQNIKLKNPYLQVIGKFIECTQFNNFIVNDLVNIQINFLDKLALIMRFLPQKEASQIINKIIQDALQSGDLSCIPYLGKCEDSVNILQAYIDNTVDIQLGGLLAAHMYYLEFPRSIDLAKLFYEYKCYLNSQQMYEQRSHLELEINEFEKMVFKGKVDLLPINQVIFNEEKKHSQISTTNKSIVACLFCKKNLGQAYLESERKNIMKRSSTQNLSDRDQRQRITNCPFCSHHFAKCCICVMPLTIQNIYLDKDDRRKVGMKNKQEEIQQIENSYIWCQSCKHGGHFGHIMDWFKIYNKCPVADCNCECSII